MAAGISATAAQFLGLRIVAEALQANIVARQSVITETVFASEAIIRLMRQASDLGFKVIVYFVALPDVETAIRRVALRVAKGGHNVPEADIRRRWPRAHENLGRAVTVADEVSVFANEGRGRPIRLVARALQGSIVLLKSDAPPAVTAVLGPLIG